MYMHTCSSTYVRALAFGLGAATPSRVAIHVRPLCAGSWLLAYGHCCCCRINIKMRSTWQAQIIFIYTHTHTHKKSLRTSCFKQIWKTQSEIALRFMQMTISTIYICGALLYLFMLSYLPADHAHAHAHSATSAACTAHNCIQSHSQSQRHAPAPCELLNSSWGRLLCMWPTLLTRPSQAKPRHPHLPLSAPLLAYWVPQQMTIKAVTYTPCCTLVALRPCCHIIDSFVASHLFNNFP